MVTRGGWLICYFFIVFEKDSTIATLTHWGWVTQICVSKFTIIGSDNGLTPGRHQAIIWTNAGILLIGPLGTNFSEILIGIQTFSLSKMHLKMSSAKWHLFGIGLNGLSKSVLLFGKYELQKYFHEKKNFYQILVQKVCLISAWIYITVSHKIVGPHTVWCCYNLVEFLRNSHSRHPIARLWGPGMGCLLWLLTLMHVLLQSLLGWVRNCIILVRAITAPHCI